MSTHAFVNECTLTDKSKVYDVVLVDLSQVGGEDRLRINCTDRKAAMELSAALEELIKKHSI